VNKKELWIFGLVALVSLPVMFVSFNRITGGVFVECPSGYVYQEGFCVEEACKEPGVKCMKEYNFIKRPDCVCIRYIDKLLCAIKGNEKTGINSALCTRGGQVDKVCGSYDSRKKQCAENPFLEIS